MVSGAQVCGNVPSFRWKGEVDQVAVGVATLEEAFASGAWQEDFSATPRTGGGRPGVAVEAVAANRADDDDAFRFA